MRDFEQRIQDLNDQKRWLWQDFLSWLSLNGASSLQTAFPFEGKNPRETALSEALVNRFTESLKPSSCGFSLAVSSPQNFPGTRNAFRVAFDPECMDFNLETQGGKVFRYLPPSVPLVNLPNLSGSNPVMNQGLSGENGLYQGISGGCAALDKGIWDLQEERVDQALVLGVQTLNLQSVQWSLIHWEEIADLEGLWHPVELGIGLLIEEADKDEAAISEWEFWQTAHDFGAEPREVLKFHEKEIPKGLPLLTNASPKLCGNFRKRGRKEVFSTRYLGDGGVASILEDMLFARSFLSESRPEIAVLMGYRDGSAARAVWQWRMP